MPVTLYELTIPVFIRQLQNLTSILKKASSHANASTFPTSSLAPDMKPLTFQIQTCSDTAKGAVFRLGGSPKISMEDNEKTMEELITRLEKTIEILRAAKPEDFEGKDEVETVLASGTPYERKFTGRNYVLRYALPNFYFHYVTAYGILRSKGVEIGKMDYLGAK